MRRVAFVFAFQTWLAETPEKRKTASSPAYMSVIMSCLSPAYYCDSIGTNALTSDGHDSRMLPAPRIPLMLSYTADILSHVLTSAGTANGLGPQTLLANRISGRYPTRRFSRRIRCTVRLGQLVREHGEKPRGNRAGCSGDVPILYAVSSIIPS